MAILRAGPWGNLTDSFQAVPSNTGADGLTFYPVNCAKADWPSQKWTAYYEVEAIEDGCPGPSSVTATSFLSGTQQLTQEEDCSYRWIDPAGAYYGELHIYYSGGLWLYDQYFSLAIFETAAGGSDPEDPTGTYSGYSGTYTVTTP